MRQVDSSTNSTTTSVIAIPNAPPITPSTEHTMARRRNKPEETAIINPTSAIASSHKRPKIF